MAIRDWVIIATERAKRPEDFAAKPYSLSSDSAANCPFCPGREAKTPPEIYAVRNKSGWQVRVIENAFPALKSTGEPTRSTTPAGFIKMNGVGRHEVIIESPDHEQIIATLPQEHVDQIFLTYRQRYLALASDPRIESVILFKNHGHNAGTSLHHPHSQIIALPVIPEILNDRLESAGQYYKETGHCLYCDLLKMEGTEKERIICENNSFVAFAPFASRFPFETWVLPKKHSSNFGAISEADCLELSAMVKTVLEKLYRTLNNPDFNFAFYSAPCRAGELASFHWNLKIFPRITSTAGFELGSGVMINTVVPEAAAQFLREGGEK